MIVYERHTYQLLDFFGDVGGLIAILRISGSFLVALFASRFFDAELVREAYRIQRYGEDKQEFRPSNQHQNSMGPLQLQFTDQTQDF